MLGFVVSGIQKTSKVWGAVLARMPKKCPHQAASDENTRIFIGWRARNGLNLSQSAEAVGVGTRSITRYSNGRESVPRTLARACLGWERLQEQPQLRRA